MTLKTFGLDQFGFLVFSLQWTILLTVIALVGGGLLGFAIALARTAHLKPVRIAAATYIQVIQGIPVLMILFLSYYGLSLAGFELPPLFAAGASMTIYASGYLAEIWRGFMGTPSRLRGPPAKDCRRAPLQRNQNVGSAGIGRPVHFIAILSRSPEIFIR